MSTCTQRTRKMLLCFIALSENDYNGHLGARISSIFVILFVSSAFTFFPVVAKRMLDLAAEVYVERKYGVHKDETATGIFIQGGNQDNHLSQGPCNQKKSTSHTQTTPTWTSESDSITAEQSSRQQITAFLILEFGIIFHCVIIGLNLGVPGSEFATLYPVLVFHQSFEGLGIGAQMSAIPFGHRPWLPWMLCAMYGLTTPVSIAIGLGVRDTYNPGSKTALIVQGILNAISAGVLIYSGLVELLARDFLFDPCRTKRRSHLLYMVFCTLLGAGVMALIGRWA
ncbi:ZIP zinc transporter-domain-containing protein [Aspergillus alliaceus]|uniref:ZIP zinc transporter-domain-containing protein n=1 Tax=Petromyces alliaceus TaxID=209559 RepID=A0A5N7CGT1_PETAA|nr:ZIP zinc transporter-domain-containing protein [Aspergillus alliaceus]